MIRSTLAILVLVCLSALPSPAAAAVVFRDHFEGTSLNLNHHGWYFNTGGSVSVGGGNVTIISKYMGTVEEFDYPTSTAKWQSVNCNYPIQASAVEFQVTNGTNVLGYMITRAEGGVMTHSAFLAGSTLALVPLPGTPPSGTFDVNFVVTPTETTIQVNSADVFTTSHVTSAQGSYTVVLGSLSTAQVNVGTIEVETTATNPPIEIFEIGAGGTGGMTSFAPGFAMSTTHALPLEIRVETLNAAVPTPPSPQVGTRFHQVDTILSPGAFTADIAITHPGADVNAHPGSEPRIYQRSAPSYDWAAPLATTRVNNPDTTVTFTTTGVTGFSFFNVLADVPAGAHEGWANYE